MNWMASIALVPLALGPLPQEDRVLTLGTCLGTEITIPLDDDSGGKGGDCHPKGCHAASCREKSQKSRKSAL